ncbi:MAG: F0F1 ATP synthase subunit delta, partial [Acetobacteraceae bacterium]|nr:F0F1 ATP synthase subunit delta [Acetobacteraceae bacterium]
MPLSDNPRIAEIAEAMKMARDARAATDAVPARYAGGLLSLADELRQKGDEGVYDRLAEALAGLETLYGESAEFRSLVDDPRIGRDAQMKGVMAVAESAGLDGTVRNFLGVIVTNRRLSLLPRILAAFRAQLAARRGEETAEVVSAVPLSDAQARAVEASLIRAGHARVRIAARVDPSILGGLVVKIGSRLYDSSIRSRLQRLSQAM